MWSGNPIPYAGHKVFPCTSFYYRLHILHNFIIFCLFCWYGVLKGYSRSGQFITTAKCATKILSWLLNTWNGFKGEPSKKHKRQNHMLTNTIDPTDLGECIQRFNDGNTISSGKIGCISANISGPNWKYIRAKWDWNFHNKIPFSKLLMCHVPLFALWSEAKSSSALFG